MRLLAVSYMLPPVLAPQAIQVGRLLAHLPFEIATVSGPLEGGAPDRRGAFALEVPFAPALSGLALVLARRFVPFYGRIPDEFRRWVPRAEAATLARLAATGFRPELLASFGEPMSDHLLGLRLKRRLEIPWVAHFSDPWADNPFRAGQVLSRPINRRLEAAVIEAADRLVFTSAETLDLVMRNYPAAGRSRAAVVPHGFEASLYPPPRARPAEIVVRHVGNFYGRRHPLPLLNALRRLHRSEPALLEGVRFEFVGRTPLWLPWHPAYYGLPAGLVRFIGIVPYRRSLELMTGADLLLVLDAPAALSVFLPSKLIDYLGAGVPVMGIVPPGTSAALLARLGAVVADPSRPDEIEAGLRRALAETRQRRLLPSPSPWGDPAIRAGFAAERTAARFAEILGEAQTGRPR